MFANVTLTVEMFLQSSRQRRHRPSARHTEVANPIWMFKIYCVTMIISCWPIALLCLMLVRAYGIAELLWLAPCSVMSDVGPTYVIDELLCHACLKMRELLHVRRFLFLLRMSSEPSMPVALSASWVQPLKPITMPSVFAAALPCWVEALL